MNQNPTIVANGPTLNYIVLLVGEQTFRIPIRPTATMRGIKNLLELMVTQLDFAYGIPGGPPEEVKGRELASTARDHRFS